MLTRFTTATGSAEPDTVRAMCEPARPARLQIQYAIDKKVCQCHASTAGMGRARGRWGERCSTARMVAAARRLRCVQQMRHATIGQTCFTTIHSRHHSLVESKVRRHRQRCGTWCGWVVMARITIRVTVSAFVVVHPSHAQRVSRYLNFAVNEILRSPDTQKAAQLYYRFIII